MASSVRRLAGVTVKGTMSPPPRLLGRTAATKESPLRIAPRRFESWRPPALPAAVSIILFVMLAVMGLLLLLKVPVTTGTEDHILLGAHSTTGRRPIVAGRRGLAYP